MASGRATTQGRRARARGFTLIQIMVGVALLGIVLTLLMQTLSEPVEQAGAPAPPPAEATAPPPEETAALPDAAPPPADAAEPPPRRHRAARPSPAFSSVTVFFATDRNRTGSTAPAAVFGSGRGSVTYGACEVSIPRDHRMGELEAPFSFLGLSLPEDQTKHVVLLSTEVYPASRYFAALGQRIGRAPAKSALIFVHGYNVTFADAARRTAQMTYDLGFEGAPVFYSWPSQGKETAYPKDEENIRWSEANLKRFLDDFLKRTDAQNIYLIAHSMGNRGAVAALGAIFAANPQHRQRFREIILTAPDIDAEIFVRDIAPQIVGSSTTITLYASSADRALQLSKRFHGYPRLGDAGNRPVIIPGIETVDATTVDTSFLKHSYYAETSSVLSDMFYLIRQGLRAKDRFALETVKTPDGKEYWKFKP